MPKPDEQPVPLTLTGTCRSYRVQLTDRGYGFLTGADGVEYFFHRTAAPECFDDLDHGVPVRFLPTIGPRGPRAEAVQLQRTAATDSPF